MPKLSFPARIAVAVAPLAFLAIACGSDDAGSAATGISFDLSALEDSGVTGTAELAQDGTAVTGKIELSGFEPNTAHGMHLHGEAEGEFDCDNRTTNHLIDFPDLQADADGNVSAELSIEADEGFVKSGTYVMVHAVGNGETIEAEDDGAMDEMDMDEAMEEDEAMEDAEMKMEEDGEMDMEDDGHAHTHGTNPGVTCGNAA